MSGSRIRDEASDVSGDETESRSRRDEDMRWINRIRDKAKWGILYLQTKTIKQSIKQLVSQSVSQSINQSII